MKAKEQHQALSSREQQIIVLAARGCTDETIAHRLNISPATVRTYWERIKGKLGASNRTELVATALREQSVRVLDKIKSENMQLLTQIQSLHANELQHQRGSLIRDLMESALHPIILVGESGCIEHCNSLAAATFGYEPEELIGQHVNVLVPERYREAHLEHQRHYLAHPERRKMGEHLATLALRKDGSEFPVVITLSVSQTPTGPIVICILTEMTDPLADFGMRIAD
jgi:PAS domain S-box-containing protein